MRDAVEKELPTGTVTFLMTDVEGNSGHWVRDFHGTNRSLQFHDAVVCECVEAEGGYLPKVRGEGDSWFAIFPKAGAAIEAAVKMRQRLEDHDWGQDPPLKVRFAIHSGEAIVRDGDYYGPSVNRCARLRSAAHGDQILVSDATVALIQDLPDTKIPLRDLGRHRLRDVPDPFRIYEVELRGHTFPPLRTLSLHPNNLPSAMTSFVGRKQAIATLTQKLRTGRLLTLLGAGVNSADVAAKLFTIR